jgi:hypothetical protein
LREKLGPKENEVIKELLQLRASWFLLFA